MEYILKLQPKHFDYINNGTKRIELRLYDEKRQKIAIHQRNKNNMVLSEYELKKYNKNTLKNSFESKSVFCFVLTD